jgi:hypothetical protein
MTNKELKRQSFLEATRKRKAKQNAFYLRFPESKLYDEGKIGWNEYLKLAKETKEKERAHYRGNANYDLYDDGLITWDEFQDLERGR